MPRGTRYLPRQKAGVDIRQVTKCRRATGGEEAGANTFADVRRKCHLWLMQHDETYRKTHAAPFGKSFPK